MSPLVASLYYLCFLLLVVLAVFILIRNPRAWLNRCFSLGSLALLGWLFTLFLYDGQHDPYLLTLLGRLNFAASAVAILFGYLFVRQLTGRPDRYTRLLILETAVLVIMELATPLIDRQEIIRGGQHATVFGPLFVLHLLHMLSYPVVTVYVAFAAARVASRRLRSQLQLIGTGILLTGAIALFTDLVLPYFFHDFGLQDVGALSSVLFLGTVAYTITVHHLFDIRIIVKKTVVFALLLAFVLAVYSGGVLFLAGAFPLGTPGERRLLQVAGILLIAFGFDPLRRWLEEKTERLLFRKEYERQAVLTRLALRLNTVTSLSESLKEVLQSVSQTLHPRFTAAFTFAAGQEDPGSLTVKRLEQIGHYTPARLLSLAQEPVLKALSHYHSPLLVETLLHEARETEASGKRRVLRERDAKDHRAAGEPEIKREALRQLQERGIAAALPLLQGEQLIGLLVLGEKQSGDQYSSGDLELLEAVGVQAVSAIQKASLYEGDQAKSEFVSIAAHELLTPITAVEGYLSFILDEGMGKVDPRARGYLEKARPALHRLSDLVKDLLSVSRLEAGRMSVRPQEVDLITLIQQVIDQLAPVARQKKIGLTFQPPSSLPLAWADPARTTQVLVNLVSNALKYTREGSVSVRVSVVAPAQTASNNGLQTAMRIEVQDTGFGLSPEAQSHLFQKFYRVTTSETANIQGTGLGLYITRQLVERMGGTIAVESKEGKGSTFILWLPSAPAPHPPPPRHHR